MIPEHLKKYNPKLFNKGKRGLIYIIKKNKKKFAIKIKNPNSLAFNRIENEINFLKLLNKYKIGPKLKEYGIDYLCYEFIEGDLLKDYLLKSKKPKKVLDEIMKQCEKLDELKINKEEMHHPVKNIIIRKNKPVLIDFERCHFTSRPKNVNQFKEFLRRLNHS
jgi:predicted Ser/Thr protein kinase